MAYLCPETLDYAEEQFPGFKVKWAKNLLRKEKDAQDLIQEEARAAER